VKRVVIVATASGNGKTTLGRLLAVRLGVPFVETDSLVHGPGWVETPDDELRARMEPILAGQGWVVDGPYTRKLGTMVLDAADTVVWLDQPVRVWLPRLVRRTARRAVRREQLWNGNRESLWTTLFSGDSVVWYAVRNYRRRRRQWEAEWLPRYPVVRLRSPEEVERWLTRSG
jgi:adenylate kinase family enzyme